MGQKIKQLPTKLRTILRKGAEQASKYEKKEKKNSHPLCYSNTSISSSVNVISQMGRSIEIVEAARVFSRQ